MNNLELSHLVRLNYCSSSELMILEGIGPKRAEAIIDHRRRFGPYLSIEDLEVVPGMSVNLVSKLVNKFDWSFNGYFVDPPKYIQADARHLDNAISTKVDLIVTSPPYWQKRDYGHPQQLGQETTPERYVENLCDTVDSWIPLLHSHASVFLNIGDTYQNYALTSIPAILEVELRKRQWLLVNKIIWSKSNGVPEPLQYRLANRYEVILQLARSNDYYSDTHALAQYLGQSANPGDVWNIPHSRSKSDHLAPFPDELVRRIIQFACPEHVCKKCGSPFRRNIEPTFELDMTRPQARRAIELFSQAGLTEAHLKAIRAVGISDAGKGQKVQMGSDFNAAQTKRLAKEAKKVLGGYFREFTFSKKIQVGWSKCKCQLNTRPGMVLDPFMGSGTSIRIACELGRVAIGSDLILPE